MKNPLLLSGLFSIGLIIGGCSHVGMEVAELSLTGDCQAYGDTDLSAKADSIDSRTPTREIQCLLDYLRATTDNAILQTPFPSRICLLLAERQDNQKIQEKLAAEGVGFAERAISLGAREDGQVLYYWAVNMGLVIRKHPVLALKNLIPMAERLETAQQKVPAEESGGPGRVLGMLYLKAPPWPQNIGDCDKALALLKQTVEQYPQHPLNHLFYAQALWDINESDSLEEIRKELEKTRELLKETQWEFAAGSWVKEVEAFEKQLPTQ